MEKLGNITLYNADNMDIMKQYPDKYFDLAIVDPPYGIGEDGSKNHARDNIAPAKKYKPYEGNDLTAPDSKYFDLLQRKSKNMIIWGANHFIDNLSFNGSSPCWIVWDKDNGESDFADCELAWTSFNTAVRKFKWKWNGMFQQNMKNKQKRIHPNEKPIALYKWILQKYAKQGDKILDTHFGSLSIGIACHDLGFELTAIELDNYYYEAGKKRLMMHQKQMRMF